MIITLVIKERELLLDLSFMSKPQGAGYLNVHKFSNTLNLHVAVVAFLVVWLVDYINSQIH